METQGSSIGWLRRIVLLAVAAVVALTIAVVPAQALSGRDAADVCEDRKNEERCCERKTDTQRAEKRCKNLVDRDDDDDDDDRWVFVIDGRTFVIKR